jgi:hypothetical protein
MSFPKSVTLSKNLFKLVMGDTSYGFLHSRIIKTKDGDPLIHIGLPGDTLTLHPTNLKEVAWSDSMSCGGTPRRAYLTSSGETVFLTKKQLLG